MKQLYSVHTKEKKKGEILFFCINFYYYPIIISNEFSKNGFDVVCFNDRPSSNAFIKALIRINPKLIHFVTSIYLRKIVNKLRNDKISKVILTDGQSFLRKDVLYLKSVFPSAEFVFSALDSSKNFPNFLDFYDIFDRCYSFDDGDVKKYPSFQLLPDFYYLEKPFAKKMKQFDFIYIGTAHPNKLLDIERIEKQMLSAGYSGFVYNYLPSRLVYFYHKMTSKVYRNKKMSDFHYSPLSYSQIITLYSKSDIIIDSASCNQVGLTPRTIDSIGMKMKLITTNQNIKNYDFYESQNIYLLDKEFINFDDCFFHSQYKTLNNGIYQKYSLEHWCRIILYGN